MELERNQSPLPDVARETGLTNFPALDWVGMSAIEVPVLLPSSEGHFRQAALVEAQVSLDKSPSRGIHMSRLYLAVQNQLSTTTLSPELLEKLGRDFLASHESLSSSARVKVELSWPLQRPALKSGFKAWRSYPVALECVIGPQGVRHELETLVTYSSTCPASAALSRQLIQDQFRVQFQSQDLEFADLHQWLGTTEGIVATPHAQRSRARVRVSLKDLSFSVEELLNMVEEALGTPVQGAVKREDEQEFALRNGQNLMFCEDAARRVKASLDSQKHRLQSYWAQFVHEESLHPHNAVSQISWQA